MNPYGLNQLSLQNGLCGAQALQGGLQSYYEQSWGPSVYQTSHMYSQLAQAQCYQQEPLLTGEKHVVICAGCSVECDTLDLAQAKAEELAHAKSANAYILKPIRKVAPKRDVVTIDL